MRNLHQFFLLLMWCIYLIVIQRTETFLFRRKTFGQMLMDPYQVKPEKITTENLFKWLNMKHHIKYKLWTRENPKWAQEIKIGDMESLQTSNYNSKRLTKVLIHGWAHSANEVYTEDWIFLIRDAYLRLSSLNILILDYNTLSRPSMYYSNSPELAASGVSELILFLVKNGAEFDHFHLIGFSWGAHVAGIAGYKLNGKIGRISGLDPANPTFRLTDNRYRLDKTDAKFVDIIHTGGGPFLGGHLGLMTPLGHADFYPNGGISQPRCSEHWIKLYESIECDHGRSVLYFVESINSPFAFFACPCENWMKFVKGGCSCSAESMSYMGEHSSHSSRGIFYLFTKGEMPFGQGPHMNISMQSIEDEYDPNWSKYSHPQHEFTSSSARSYLSDIVQRSIRTFFGSLNSPISKVRSGNYNSIKSGINNGYQNGQNAVIQRSGTQNVDRLSIVHY